MGNSGQHLAEFGEQTEGAGASGRQEIGLGQQEIWYVLERYVSGGFPWVSNS